MAESKWNSADKSADITLSNGDRTATGATAAWKSARSTDSKSGDGKWYFEVINSGGGTSSEYITGVCESGHTLANFVGNGAAGWGVQNGATWNNNSSGGGPAIDNNDVIMVALEISGTTVKLWFGVNNTWYNSGDPGAGTNHTFTWTYANPIFAACSPYAIGAAITSRFRAAQQSYSLPSGFVAWDTNAAEESTSSTGAITMTPTNTLGAAASKSSTGAIALSFSTQMDMVNSLADSGAITLTLAGQIDLYPLAHSSTGAITLTVTNTKDVEASMESTGAIVLTLSPQLALVSAISESANIINFLNQAAQVWDVWAMTLDAGPDGKLYPAYEFSNFDFNSFARCGGRTYAAGEGGIYVLGDYDDDGTDVDAFAKTGKAMLGTERDKRCTHAYLIGTSDDAMQVDVEMGGQTFSYEARAANTGDAMRQKVKFGRGMKAGFAQFTIRNKDGSDFEINDLMAAVIPLSRRVT